jgi:ABC-type multidrug transport system fused ATPase/permease subunit
MIVAFPFVLGSFAEFIVQERESKAKHLQTVAGVKPFAYWISSYAWDTINYQFPCWIIIILLFIFNIEVFTTTSRDALSGTILTIMIFGPAAASFVYCFSFLFKSPSACNVVTVILAFFIGFIGALVSFILRLLGIQQELQGVNDVDFFGIATIIEYCLRLHPSFSFSRALFYIQNVELFVLANNKPDLSVWSFDVMLIDFLFLVGQIVVYFILAVYIDRKSTHPGFLKRLIQFPVSSVSEPSQTDEDVLAEEQRVKSGDSNNDSIVIYDLLKQYGSSTLAVNHVSLGIPPGQCFGLLGTNGAGKYVNISVPKSKLSLTIFHLT